jgi:pantoate--beta-alanine ligase
MTAAIVAARDALRNTLGEQRPGLVPTMGALHAGHRSLIERSARENPLTVVSVFVNPTQFSSRADLELYPRDPQPDARLATAAGADIIFAPDPVEMYPPGFDTAVEVGALAERWEGAFRPGHFRGVATVVTVLLNLVRPARSYFGEKDYQQLQIVRRLHQDLALPGEIVGCPTVRDRDGLALSSRNARLSPAARVAATAVPRALARAQAAAQAGETDARALETIAGDVLHEPRITIEYIAVVDGDTLEPIRRLRPGARMLIAADVDGTRLIDNDVIAPGGLATG